MRTALNDMVCPGYRLGHQADCGLCVCGLFWTGEMPLHNIHQHRITFERLNKRMAQADQAEALRRDNRPPGWVFTRPQPR